MIIDFLGLEDGFKISDWLINYSPILETERFYDYDMPYTVTHNDGPTYHITWTSSSTDYSNYSCSWMNYAT